MVLTTWGSTIVLTLMLHLGVTLVLYHGVNPAVTPWCNPMVLTPWGYTLGLIQLLIQLKLENIKRLNVTINIIVVKLIYRYLF